MGIHPDVSPGSSGGRLHFWFLFAAFSLLAAAGAGLAVAEDDALAGSDEVDGDRTPLHTVVPVYPKSALRDRLQGEVQVCFHIDREGSPYRIAVRNSTHRVFERPSIHAVRASTYVPLRKGEVLPAIKTCRTFKFTLEPVQDP